MFDVNEYFDGKVKSISFKETEGPSSIGVMAAGEYTFSTGAKEYMTIITGAMSAKLPGEDSWKTFKAGETFEVAANSSFDVKMEETTTYLCRYR